MQKRYTFVVLNVLYSVGGTFPPSLPIGGFFVSTDEAFNYIDWRCVPPCMSYNGNTALLNKALSSGKGTPFLCA